MSDENSAIWDMTRVYVFQAMHRARHEKHRGEQARASGTSGESTKPRGRMDYPTTGLRAHPKDEHQEVLDGANASGLRALGALADLELDALVLFQGAETGSLDLRVVHKHVTVSPRRVR